MPKLEIRRSDEVPGPSSGTKAVREQQNLYECFIRQLNGNVGELELEPGEQVRGIKTRPRRAASRLGRQIEIWDADGKVYFKAEAQRRRGGRPRKNAPPEKQ